jgi:hypothetical protein
VRGTVAAFLGGLALLVAETLVLRSPRERRKRADMSTLGLSPVAAFVLRSLHDHPDLRLPEAIAGQAQAKEAFDRDAIDRGLAELQQRGLAEHEEGRGWRITPAGRAG